MWPKNEEKSKENLIQSSVHKFYLFLFYFIIFSKITFFLESKRQEVLTEVKRKRDDKKKVLEDQLNIIKAEKSKVDSDVQAMQHQVEVRNITKKISELNW